MTPEQKQKYLDDPNLCPYCEAQDFDRVDSDGDSSNMWLTFVCNICQKGWTEEYALTGVWGKEDED